MKYVDFENHRYGFYVTYDNSRLKIVLVENRKKVCDFTSFTSLSPMSSFNTGKAYVNLTRIPFAERLLELIDCKKTGKSFKSLGDDIVEYDFSPLVMFNNKEMKRDKMKSGMIQLGENGSSVSSNVVYYACHAKHPDRYVIVTTESITYKVEKKYFVAAIRDYNIPVYKTMRKEPFKC